MIKIFVIPDFSDKMTEILELAIPDQHGTVRTVIFPRVDENYVFSGGNGDKNIYMWDTDSGKRINSLIGHEKDINSFEIDENDIMISKFQKENVYNQGVFKNKTYLYNNL